MTNSLGCLKVEILHILEHDWKLSNICTILNPFGQLVSFSKHSNSKEKVALKKNLLL